MDKKTCTTFQGFLRIIEKQRGYMWRGVGDIKYPLIPKVARDWHLGLEWLVMEEESLIHNFKIRAAPYLEAKPSNDWEWLALAQHHGLPTRLLDWSLNPLVALYFCCVNDTHSDGVVYGCMCLNDADTIVFPNPLEIEEEKKWRPYHISPRLVAQDGLFTISHDPTKPIQKGLEVQIRVKAESKANIKNALKNFGIHQGTIFPGLDGVASFVEENCFNFRGQKDRKAILAKIEDEITRRKKNA